VADNLDQRCEEVMQAFGQEIAAVARLIMKKAAGRRPGASPRTSLNWPEWR
jgi:hypothetical protein